MKVRTRRIRHIMVPALALMVAGLLVGGGCAGGRQDDRPPAPRPSPTDDRPTKDEPRSETEAILFFGDRQAMHVVPEARKVSPDADQMGKVLVEELIKGPDDPFLVPNMPRGTRLRSFEVRDGVARVDFSREFRDNHPGGSAGEGMTLNSLIFSLTTLPQINSVQVLIEGKEGETLGHVVFDQPLTRGPIRTHQIFLDRERQAWLQGLADSGRDRWRLDPLEAARREARMAAFQPSDEFRLLEVKEAEPSPETRPGTKRALVEAIHAGKKFEILMVQPVRVGDRGIWAVSAVNAK